LPFSSSWWIILGPAAAVPAHLPICTLSRSQSDGKIIAD
jgi:hypothetical protein